MNNIKSSIPTAELLKKQVQSTGRAITLPSVASARASGVPAQDMCEQCYQDLHDLLERYCEQIEVDAGNITKIAWGLDQTDRDMADGLKTRK